MTRGATGRLFGGVMLVAIGAALTQPRPPAEPVDPALALEAHASVPAPVLTVLRQACYDCHSSETRWPWYARLPLSSWLMSRHVADGRGQINFSRWGRYNPLDRADMLDEMCELAASGSMPPRSYRLVHAGARLQEAEVSGLCRWTADEADRLVEGGQ